VLSEEIIANEQVINVVLAPLSPEFTLKAIPSERDERPAEVE
jgi:hypothetical protein